MRVVHAALASLAALGIGGCPAAPREVAKTEEKPAPETVATPVDASPRPDEGAPPEPVRTSLADLVADAALVSRGELACLGGACGAAASWATCDDITAGELRVVTPEGVEDMVLVIEEDEDGYSNSVSVASKSKPSNIEIGLALRNVPPAATARFEERRLEPPVSDAETEAVREWLDKPHEPIGAIEGNFGAGVDRILVFEPKQKPLDHDVAVLLADGELRGSLPFDGVWGLEVVGTVDLDGDGTQEIVWISQAASEQFATTVSISYWSGSEFAIHDVVFCSYEGCDFFLPEKKCGHSAIKKMGRR